MPTIQHLAVSVGCSFGSQHLEHRFVGYHSLAPAHPTISDLQGPSFSSRKRPQRNRNEQKATAAAATSRKINELEDSRCVWDAGLAGRSRIGRTTRSGRRL
jgi:hypothetical protein